jgi:hypothetical protein
MDLGAITVADPSHCFQSEASRGRPCRRSRCYGRSLPTRSTWSRWDRAASEGYRFPSNLSLERLIAGEAMNNLRLAPALPSLWL